MAAYPVFVYVYVYNKVYLTFVVQDKMIFIQHMYVIQQSTKFKQLRV